MLGIYITLYQYTILSTSQLFYLNITLMGLLIAMQHIGISFPPLFLGRLCYKIGKKRVIQIAYLLMTIGTFLAGMAQGFTVFIISIFIIGAGFSVLEATLSAVLADEYPEESTRHLNFSQVAFSIGAVSGPFIAEALINSGVFFKDLYIYMSTIFLLLCFIFSFTKFQNDKGADITQNKSFKVLKFLSKRTFLFLALGIFLYVGIENTIASFADSYFEIALVVPELSATALALFWGAMIPSRLLAGIIKMNVKKMFIFLSGLVFVSVIVAMIVPNNTMKIALFALCGFGCGPLWPLMMDTVAKKNKGAAGPVLNVMMAFSGFGGATLPLVAGVLVDFTSQTAAYYTSVVAVIMMLYMYLSSLKVKKLQ